MVLITVSDVTTSVRHRRELDDRLRLQEEEAERARAELTRLAEVNRELLDANEQFTRAQEELRSANEEFLIGTEETQAATEEVETLNEELQATNEELETLNEELQATVEELNTTNDDLPSCRKRARRSSGSASKPSASAPSSPRFSPAWTMLCSSSTWKGSRSSRTKPITPGLAGRMHPSWTAETDSRSLST
jgi:hypothetical protein